MRQKIVAGLCAGLLTLSTAPLTANAHDVHKLNNKIEILEAQLRELKAAVDREVQSRQASDADLSGKVAAAVREAEVAKTLPQVAANERIESNLKLFGNTSLNYGGYIRVNGIFDDFSDGPRPGGGTATADRILVPGSIPVGSEVDDGTTFNSDVATSRFFFKTASETAAGTIRSYVELDFLDPGGNEAVSNSNGARIRHASLSWDYSDTASLTVGQTWGTFFNVGALPDEVDFIGPTSGSLFNRQQQIRWTKKLNGGGSIMLAAENPSVSLDDGGSGIASALIDDSSYPDLVARYNGKSGSHQYAVSVIARDIAFDDGVTDESEIGFGFNWAGKFNINPANEIKYSLTTGTVGRYLALLAFRDGAIDADGNLDLATTTGGYLSWKALISPKWSSVLTAALSRGNLANGVADTTTEEISNFNASIFYNPTPKLRFGGGIIQANRELENGLDGDLTRLQFMSRYVV